MPDLTLRPCVEDVPRGTDSRWVCEGCGAVLGDEYVDEGRVLRWKCRRCSWPHPALPLRRTLPVAKTNALEQRTPAHLCAPGLAARWARHCGYSVDLTILVSCTLVAAGRATRVLPVLQEVLRRWSTPAELTRAPLDHLAQVVRPLGMQRRRARALHDLGERAWGNDDVWQWVPPDAEYATHALALYGSPQVLMLHAPEDPYLHLAWRAAGRAAGMLEVAHDSPMPMSASAEGEAPPRSTPAAGPVRAGTSHPLLDAVASLVTEAKAHEGEEHTRRLRAAHQLLELAGAA